MKAAKDAGEEYYDPTREDNILGRNKTRLALWEEHLKDPIVALDKARKCGKFVLEVSAQVLGGRSVLQWLALASSKVFGKPIWESVWPFLDPWNSVCVCAQHSWSGMYQGSTGRTASSFFLIQKEPETMQDSDTFSPFINADIRTPFFSADVLKKCALIALHFIAEEGRGEWLSNP